MTNRAKAQVATLDVDVGSTRTKWRCGDQSGVAAGLDAPVLAHTPRRVRIACGAAAIDQVAEQFRRAYGVAPEFAAPAPSAAGVTCAQPASLEVDRWLAIIAAWRQAPGPLMVADLGATATLDFVDDAGRHLGGYVVPGLGLMPVALAQGAAGVRVAGDLGADLGPGRSAAQAVRRGVMAMLLDFIEASCRRFEQSAGAATLFLTGGDAVLVADRLGRDARLAPDLVLDGLPLALP